MALTDDMVLSSMFDTIAQLYRADSGPFPYDDCSRLIVHVGESARGLIPDLTRYSATLAGYRSRGHRISKMSATEISEARKAASGSFFAIHPEYEACRIFITKSETPYLTQKLDLYEKMRVTLSAALEHIELQENNRND